MTVAGDDVPDDQVDDQVDEAPTAPSTRRRFLRRAGLGTAAMFGGGFAGGFTAHRTDHALAATDEAAGHGCHGAGVYDAAAPGGTPTGIVGGAPGSATASVYGHGAQPPMSMRPDALDAVTR